jgi:predicted Zn-dependent protease
VASDVQMEFGKKLLGEMRESFARGDWDKTTSAYEQIMGIETDRATRLEATCLAARALVAVKHRSAARHLIRTVAKREYKKPSHYEFLARAYLDLKQFKEAAEACTRAEELRVAEQK